MFARILLTIVIVLLVALGLGVYYVVSLFESDDVLPVASASSARQTESGEVVGFVDRYEAHAWMGIPYAAPPVGDLRWRAPRSPGMLPPRYQALKAGSMCPQTDLGARVEGETSVNGSEDCLYLNIWAPLVAAELVPKGPDRLPVMVWVHGGANVLGHGAQSLYNGSLMASEHNVVFVSINYRLGPLGWFSHPALRRSAATPETASGNFGTLDIIAALAWIHRNIGNFGGDPDNVTVFGESAGGANTLTMMTSPLAAGLFHRAIVQSGYYDPVTLAEAENFTDEEPAGMELSGKEVVSRLLVNDGSAPDEAAADAMQAGMSDAEIARYLRGKSVEEIFAACRTDGPSLMNVPNLFRDGYVLPDLETAEIFSDPANYNAVPLIIGTNRDEIKLFQAMGAVMNDGVVTLPGDVDLARYNRRNEYHSARWKAQSTDRIARAIAARPAAPVFAYRFDVDDLRNYGLFDLKDLLGAAHAMELPFVFGDFEGPIRLLHPGSYQEERDILSEAMMSYWAEFAHTGSPGAGRHGEQLRWKAWSNDPGAERLMVFDYESDQGIHMSTEMLTMDSLKQRFLADQRFEDDSEFCDMYEELFEEQPAMARCLQ